MNNRVSVSVAIALGGVVGALLTHSVPQAQAQASAHAAPAAQGVQAQLDRMQAQIAALQAEVKRLRTQLPPEARGLPATPPTVHGPPVYVYPSSDANALRSLLVPPSAPDVKGLKPLLIPPSTTYTVPYQYIPYQSVAPAPERRFTNIPPTRIIPLGEVTGGAGAQPPR